MQAPERRGTGNPPGDDAPTSQENLTMRTLSSVCSRALTPSSLGLVLMGLVLMGPGLLGLQGCQSAHAEEHIELTLAELPASAGVQGTSFQSVGWQGDPWQRFPGNATLVMPHSLGQVPHSVLVYLSFDDSGTSSALSAGDMARILEVTDTKVTIRNDTHADFYARIVLQ